MFFFNDLPLEIIAEVYKYINDRDFKAAQLTCHQWLKASQLPEFENRLVLKLTILDNNICEIFNHSFRNFRNIHLVYKNNQNMAIEDLIKFFSTNIRLSTKKLILENYQQLLSFETLFSILKLLPNLTELICINTTFSFEENISLTSQTDYLKFSKMISVESPNLKTLVLINNDFSTQTCLKLLSSKRNLEKLNIHLNDLDINCNVYLYQIIKNNEKSLKQLSLKLNKSCASFLKSLLLCSNLKLQNFSLMFSYTKLCDIVNFFKMQNLISLSLKSCFKLSDSTLNTILKQLPQLEALNIQDNRKLTSAVMFEILNLKNLRSLNINNMSKSWSNGIQKGLVKDSNYKLIDFRCLNVSLSDDAYIKIFENLPNLQVLHCGCKTLNDVAVQSIIVNCQNLLELNLFASSNVTDYGLTGINLKTKEKTGYSISTLDKLVSLNLRRCCKITDQTLLYGLRFKKLRTLYLPACFPHFSNLPWLKIRKVSLNGFTIFTKNCAGIKELNLLGCSGSENLDKAIEIIMNTLKELKIMVIARHCERVLISQEAYLHKNRRDLSRIEFTCICDVCLNIAELCEKFLNNEI